jgi:soluble lytic murein transglycosylase
MRSESHYNPEAQSGVGAQGLMQIMPATAVHIARLLGDSAFNLADLKEPRVSIAYGAYYLQKLLKYYGGNYGVAAAAYNAGPIAVNNWIEACRGCDLAEFVESIPYRETRRYVKSIMKNLVTYKAIYGGTQFKPNDLVMPAQLPEGETLF